MNDSAVVTGLMPAEAFLFFEDDETRAGPRFQKRQGGGNADDAAADYAVIKCQRRILAGCA